MYDKSNFVWLDSPSEGDDRRMVSATDRAEVYERRTPDGIVYEVVWPYICHFRNIEDAERSAAAVGSYLFLAAGESALVARGVDEGALCYEVGTAESFDQRHVGSTLHEPGDVLWYGECGDRFDDASSHFLDTVLADPPPDLEIIERFQSQGVSGDGRHDVVQRNGTRVTRSEWSSPCPDGVGACYTGEAVVAECATIEEAKARFWGCVAALWRVAAGEIPDLQALGVTRRKGDS